jgi:hypothetical protein
VKRWVFTILSALSLLLCVAVVVLWVRSYWRNDSIGCISADVISAASSTRGSICFWRQSDGTGRSEVGWFYERSEPVSMLAYLPELDSSDPDPHEVNLRLAGFALWHRRETVGGVAVFEQIAVAPHWFAALVTAALPVHALRLYLHRRKRPDGSCPSCGYDLRATPGRCPECGLVPAAPPPPRGTGQ